MKRILPLLLLLIALLVFTSAQAQDAAKATAAKADAAKTPAAAPDAEAPPEAEASTVMGAIFSPVGILIIFLSVAGMALFVEHLLSIRANSIMPDELAEAVRAQIVQGNIAGARQVCQNVPSTLALVLDAGLAEADVGWVETEKAAEDMVADQSARLMRKIEYLSLIGNIAPMLGLLGTVIGMIAAFGEVASSEGAANAADLAGGIYLALVTTVEGLIVAIPSLAAFAFFRNRVDHLMAEVALATGVTLGPLKRRRRSNSHAPQQQQKSQKPQQQKSPKKPPQPPPIS